MGCTANVYSQSEATAAEGVLAETSPLVAVQQEYQQLIGLSLSLTERPPSGLTGLLIYDSLADVRDSLARVVVNQPGSVFQELHDRLDPILQSLASQREALHTTLTDWRDLAACFPNPTDKACPGIAEIKLDIQKLQDRWRAAPADAPLVVRFREGVAKRLTHWGDGLFVCYTVPGVPATNNDLESRFGQIKRGLRRQTGQIQVDDRLRRAGSALFGMPPQNEAELLARLRQVPRSHIAAARAVQRAHARPYQMRRRFKHQRGKMIATVEAKAMTLVPIQKPIV